MGLLVLHSKSKDMNIRVIATLVVVAHLKKSSVCLKILLECFESSTVEREL